MKVVILFFIYLWVNSISLPEPYGEKVVANSSSLCFGVGGFLSMQKEHSPPKFL